MASVSSMARICPGDACRVSHRAGVPFGGAREPHSETRHAGSADTFAPGSPLGWRPAAGTRPEERRRGTGRTQRACARSRQVRPERMIALCCACGSGVVRLGGPHDYGCATHVVRQRSPPGVPIFVSCRTMRATSLHRSPHDRTLSPHDTQGPDLTTSQQCRGQRRPARGPRLRGGL